MIQERHTKFLISDKISFFKSIIPNNQEIRNKIGVACRDSAEGVLEIIRIQKNELTYQGNFTSADNIYRNIELLDNNEIEFTVPVLNTFLCFFFYKKIKKHDFKESHSIQNLKDFFTHIKVRNHKKRDLQKLNDFFLDINSIKDQIASPFDKYDYEIDENWEFQINSSEISNESEPSLENQDIIDFEVILSKLNIQELSEDLIKILNLLCCLENEYYTHESLRELPCFDKCDDDLVLSYLESLSFKGYLEKSEYYKGFKRNTRYYPPKIKEIYKLPLFIQEFILENSIYHNEVSEQIFNYAISRLSKSVYKKETGYTPEIQPILFAEKFLLFYKTKQFGNYKISDEDYLDLVSNLAFAHNIYGRFEDCKKYTFQIFGLWELESNKPEALDELVIYNYYAKALYENKSYEEATMYVMSGWDVLEVYPDVKDILVVDQALELVSLSFDMDVYVNEDITKFIRSILKDKNSPISNLSKNIIKTKLEAKEAFFEKKYEKSIELWERLNIKGATVQKRAISLVRAEIGKCYEFLGNYSKAIYHYNHVEMYAPITPYSIMAYTYHFKKIWCEIQLKNYYRSLEYLRTIEYYMEERTHLLDAKLWELYFMYGVTYYHLNQLEDSIYSLELSLKNLELKYPDSIIDKSKVLFNRSKTFEVLYDSDRNKYAQKAFDATKEALKSYYSLPESHKSGEYPELAKRLKKIEHSGINLTNKDGSEMWVSSTRKK